MPKSQGQVALVLKGKALLAMLPPLRFMVQML